ncbi:RluA family pseudouridine synthase [Jeotgalibacillus marinus]|uniref:Pseudouridine synthase n=1 Tax=Jeotgalibacillus marinus TaxID=86667 RepID=A0ABV3Q2P6_9BACL
MNERFTMQWVVEANEDKLLLRDYLKQKNISKRALTGVKFGGGEIEVNGHVATVRKSLTQGDVVKITFPCEKRSATLIGEEIPLKILYEDEAILVINKPPFMNTIPSREHPNGSIANAIIGHYTNHNYPSAVHIVTRLDRNTSGLMLIAKHSHAHHILSKDQQRGDIIRTYLAIVHGVVDPLSGVIKEPIGRKNSSIIEREVREDGQRAITHYEVKKVFGASCLVGLKLETGRTHQIRVHMRHIGHPIVGDDLYGGKVDLMARQALHCAELQLLHPNTGEYVCFREDLPDDMKNFLNN